MRFELLQGSTRGPRLGRIETDHGGFDTPVFMPVGTQATVKGLLPERVLQAGGGAILCNAYHVTLRPGVDVIESLGGLHEFMRWPGTIVTDSGGFQIFSLARHRKVTDEGVRFKSPLDGATLELTPEASLKNQARLGADILMPLDQPVPAPAGMEETAEAARRTFAWARRTKEEAERGGIQGVFGIVQGGTHLDLRERSAADITALDFEGYAVGGLSVGEGPERMDEILTHTAPLLPADKPRYLMGVGTVRDLFASVASGMDMFDCTLPTRNGRNGTVFTRAGALRMKNAAHARDPSPIEPGCPCPACDGGFSRGYLRHLFLAGESLAMILCSMHNVRFFLDLMASMREAIREDGLEGLREEYGL
ncbi:MAG: tRNA guanosine(34) transglycosylase Tgt [Planctomycetota bacterium]|jgi:queuine tRNA-ribosyltransferase